MSTRLITTGAAAIAVAGALLVAAPSSATAAPPNGGCPEGYRLEPLSFLGAGFTGVADNVNDDGLICVRPQETGRGTHFSITDNTVPS